MKKIAVFINTLLELLVLLWGLGVIAVCIFILVALKSDVISLTTWNSYSITFYLLLFFAAISCGITTARYEHCNNKPDEFARYYPPLNMMSAWFIFILLIKDIPLPPLLIIYITVLAGIYAWLSYDYARYLDRSKKQLGVEPT